MRFVFGCGLVLVWFGLDCCVLLCIVLLCDEVCVCVWVALCRAASVLLCLCWCIV